MERDINKYYFNIFKCKTSVLEKDFTYRRGKVEIKKVKPFDHIKIDFFKVIINFQK